MAPRVVSGFAYINEGSDDEFEREEDAPTFVTHSRRVMRLYNSGMEALAEENLDRALSAFNDALHYPQSLEVRRNSPPEGDPLHGLLTVCQAALKWKAELLLKLDRDPLDAFECYKEAYELQPTDIVLCKKLGKLALEVGYVGFARWILEQSLVQRPDYIPLLEPLVEVYLELQDYEKARQFCHIIISHLSHHKRAIEVLEIYDKGVEPLEPKFQRRVNYEIKVKNVIRRFIPSFSWSAFIGALIEIIDGSKLIDEETGRCGVVLESVNTDWRMLCEAKLSWKLVHHSPDGFMDIDKEPDSIEFTREDLVSVINQEEEEGTSNNRFPLRSRCNQQKPEEQKTWNIINSFKSALSNDHLDLLKTTWQQDSDDIIISHVRVDDYIGISHFLSNIIGSKQALMSPLDLAISVLEWKSKTPVYMEGNEKELLCKLDKLLDFDSSSQYDLFMAELLLDTVYLNHLTELVGVEFSRTTKEDRVLQRSQKHVFKCIGHNSSGLLDPLGSEVCSDVFALRLYWTLGRIQLLEGRYQEAEKAFNSAIFHVENIGGSVGLYHVKQDQEISVETIEAKLIMCLYQNIIQGLDEANEAEYQDICTLLVPVLFTNKAKNESPVLLRNWKYKALVYLKDMAKLQNDMETEFHCHLHLLELVLDSESYVDINNSTLNRSSVSSQLPEVMKDSIHCLPKRETFLQILKFVSFVFERWSDDSSSLTVYQSKIFPLLEQEECQKLLRRITIKSLLHLEWCFWRFLYSDDEPELTNKSSNKTELRKRAFHEACAFLFVCTQLDPVLGTNAEVMENIAVFLYEILMEREAVCLRKTAEIKNIALHLLCLRFASWIDYLSAMEETDPEMLSPLDRHLMEINIEEKEDIRHSVEVLIDGIAHFIKCLYGLEFASSEDSTWTNKGLPSSSRSKDGLKRNTLTTVWKYLSPCFAYYESKEADLHIFNKFTGILQQFIKVMNPPHEQLMQTLSLDDEIFSPELSSLDEDLERGRLPIGLQSHTEKAEGVLKQLEHKEIHEEVYYYLCLATLEIDLEFGQGDESIMGDKGIEFNPDRYWSWECLAINYKQATEILIESCVRELLPGQFKMKPELNENLNTLLQCQKRCFQIAGILARGKDYEDERQYVHEMLAELELFKNAKTPPVHYPPLLELQLNSSSFREGYLKAKEWINGALIDGKKDKWYHYYYLGNITRKLKGAHWEQETLGHFSKAHEAAQKSDGGLIEPFYKLHCSRLKLLLAGSTDWPLLIEFNFDDQNIAIESGNERTAIFSDCRSALEFCRSKISAFHHVHYHLAKAFASQGNYIGALSYLQQLFMKGKKKFCIAFCPVDSRQCRVSQKSSSAHSQARSGAHSSPPFVKISGAGITESLWKFAACVRKYLVFYLRLLYLTRDIEMISLVGNVLTKGDFDGPKELMSEVSGKYKYPCLADMPLRAQGVRLLLLHNGLRKEIEIETADQLNSSLDRLLDISSGAVINGPEYTAISQNISQLLVCTWQMIQSITDFDTVLFSACLDVFCEEKCKLISSNRSIEALNLVIPEFHNQEKSPSVILSELSRYAEIYPVLVLRSQDISLASSIASTLQQRHSLMKDPTGRRLFFQCLFCICQVYFQKAERIQSISPESRPGGFDTVINQLVNHVSFLIRHFSELLMEMRFLSLRLMHLMQHLYEAICVMNGFKTSLIVQPNIPLKSMVQMWINEIQKVKSRPPMENVCIDLTQEEETTVKATTSDVMEIAETEKRLLATQIEDEKVENEKKSMLKEEMEVDTVNQEPVQSGGGAFANAFQQCMDYNEEDEIEENNIHLP
eukprot:g1650.t1